MLIKKTRKKPSLIEFLSYMCNFQGIIVGPLCTYNDYMDFITGNNILKHQPKDSQDSSKIRQPSVAVIMLKIELV